MTDISEEIPFDAPANWRWVRLSAVANLYTGNSISEAEKKQKYTGSAISKKPLSFYMKYAIAVANKAIEEIKQGFIKPSPDNNSCEHCIFGAICCYNKNEGVRNKSFKESMFKEERL